MNFVQIIIDLLSHENVDISVLGIKFLNELLDEDVANEGSEDEMKGMKYLTDAIVFAMLRFDMRFYWARSDLK
jgi:hypothetical protein